MKSLLYNNTAVDKCEEMVGSADFFFILFFPSTRELRNLQTTQVTLPGRKLPLPSKRLII